jgi:hypothetical protein
MTLEVRRDFEGGIVASAGHLVAHQCVARPQPQLIAGGDKE